jgi:hypothetical protein
MVRMVRCGDSGAIDPGARPFRRRYGGTAAGPIRGTLERFRSRWLMEL